MRRLVRYRKVPDDLIPYLDTWDRSFRDWGSSAVDLSQPWPTAPPGVPYLKLLRYDDDATGDVIKPMGRRFDGKVLVLIDATNSSATFQFAQNIQVHHLGALIGQCTGGQAKRVKIDEAVDVHEAVRGAFARVQGRRTRGLDSAADQSDQSARLAFKQC